MAPAPRTSIADRPAWQVALATAAVVGTLATACMMPFVGIAVAAAATMSRRGAATTIAGVWAINQLLGFTLLGFPATAQTIAWGVALGVASLGAMLVARGVLGRRPRLALLPAAFVAAFAAYEGALFAFALMAGGTETFTPAIAAAILVNDALWLAGFAALHVVLTRAAPATFGATLLPRPA